MYLPGMDIALRQRQNYYRAGALGLRALQDRGQGAQRFSPDAEARWKAFRGELTDSDRLDLLLRDGAAVHPVAFSAASVFALPDLASDEPFGPEWTSLPPSEAGATLREVAGSMFPPDVPPSRVLAATAKAWQLEPAAMTVSGVVPASRVVLAAYSDEGDHLDRGIVITQIGAS